MCVRDSLFGVQEVLANESAFSSTVIRAQAERFSNARFHAEIRMAIEETLTGSA